MLIILVIPNRILLPKTLIRKSEKKEEKERIF
jgi:hypothetical protein